MGALKIDDESVRVIGETQFDRPVYFTELSSVEVKVYFLIDIIS